MDTWTRGTWRDYDAPKRIQHLRLNHYDSLLRIPSQSLILSWRKSDDHTQFQNVINSLYSMMQTILEFSIDWNFMDNIILKSLSFFLFYTHFSVHGMLEIKILLREKEEVAASTLNFSFLKHKIRSLDPEIIWITLSTFLG